MRVTPKGMVKAKFQATPDFKGIKTLITPINMSCIVRFRPPLISKGLRHDGGFLTRQQPRFQATPDFKEIKTTIPRQLSLGDVVSGHP